MLLYYEAKSTKKVSEKSLTKAVQLSMDEHLYRTSASSPENHEILIQHDKYENKEI